MEDCPKCSDTLTEDADQDQEAAGREAEQAEEEAKLDVLHTLRLRLHHDVSLKYISRLSDYYENIKNLIVMNMMNTRHVIVMNPPPEL